MRRRGQLELYRSGDFAELEPYRGRLAALGVPTLLLFGSEDPFARVASAHRLAQEIPHARTEVLDGVGHFMFDEVPERAAAIVVDFLGELDDREVRTRRVVAMQARQRSFQLEEGTLTAVTRRLAWAVGLATP